MNQEYFIMHEKSEGDIPEISYASVHSTRNLKSLSVCHESGMAISNFNEKLINCN